MKDILRFGLIGPRPGQKYMFGSPACPVRLQSTPKGLQGAPFDTAYAQNSRQDGETFRNRRYKRNPIVLDVLVGRSTFSGPNHRKVHSDWRAALGDTTTTCRFVVVSGESGYRWKDCRLQEATQAAHWQRPGLLGTEAETVTLASDDAFWTHRDEARVYERADFGSATIRNPGDRPAWLTWTLMGATGGWAIGVGDDLVETPATEDGGYIRIHTDPAFPTASIRHADTHEEVDGQIITTTGETEDVYEWLFRGSPTPFTGASRDLVFREPLPGGGNRTAPIPLTIKAINPQESARVVVEFTPKSVSAW